MRELYNWKGVNIITAEVCLDRIHMLVEIPLKMSVSSFMGFLKGKRKYYVDAPGKNDKKIKEYFQNQLQEDEVRD